MVMQTNESAPIAHHTIIKSPGLTQPIEVSSDDINTLQEIGRLRYEVWESEGVLDKTKFPDGVWVDEMDYGDHARHWVVRDATTEKVVGAGRLTRHDSLEDDYRDVKLWRDCGASIEAPVIDFGRLVVLKQYRRRSIARALDIVRLEAAKHWKVDGTLARAIVCTASEANMTVLCELGFYGIGQTVVFPDRPKVTFHALQYDLSDTPCSS